MPTFPRGYANHEANARNAKVLEQLAREQSGDVRVERQVFVFSPADAVTLRGIPAIGRGVMGVVPGTQPEQTITSREW